VHLHRHPHRARDLTPLVHLLTGGWEGHRFEATGSSIPFGSVEDLAEDQKSGQSCDATHSGRWRIGRAAPDRGAFIDLAQCLVDVACATGRKHELPLPTTRALPNEPSR